MAKARDPNLPQINAGQMLYGAMSIELLPNGENGILQIPVWDGTQWHIATIEGEGRIDIAFDSDSSTITFIAAEDRVYDTFTADAVFLKTVSGSFAADATLV